MNEVRHIAAEIPGIPRGPDGPVFRAPWEAQAFAIVVALHDRGLFTWAEWAAILAEEIQRAQAAGDPDTGETYYHHWLAALERIAAQKGRLIRQLSPAIAPLGSAPPTGPRTARRSL